MGFCCSSLELRDATVVHRIFESQPSKQLRLRQAESKSNLEKLLRQTLRPHASPSCHQKFPPDEKEQRPLGLTLSVVADRLPSRFRFAVSWNLPCSTAMLITRIDGMVSYALCRCQIIKD